MSHKQYLKAENLQNLRKTEILRIKFPAPPLNQEGKIKILG